MNYVIHLPGRITFGPGSIEKIKDTVAKHKPGSVLVFTDKNLRKLGIIDSLIGYIEETKVPYDIIDEVKPEPSVQDVEQALSKAASKEIGLIAGIGGGSVLDTAKLASLLIGAPYSIRDLLDDPLQARKRYPSVMIPTTCGTGSEATGNGIVAVPEEQTKKGISNPVMIPDEVILDVDLIAKLPKPIVAATGVDALAHCVECYTSNKATPLSDLYAAEGARLIFHNIEKACLGSEDIDARQNMLLGAFYGGAAITGSGTTAVHALAYPLGGKYHIAHGISNAMLFSQIMRFNRDACIPQFSNLCNIVYPEFFGKDGSWKAGYMIDRIAEIVGNTGIPANLREFGVKPEDLDFLVDAGSKQTRLLANNRRAMSLDDIRNIYKQVL